MRKRAKLTPYPLDSQHMREYYEMEAAAGHRQDAMYKESDRWDRYWHEKRLEHLGDVFAALDGQSFLEVGCAEGKLTRLFHTLHPAAHRTGLDISEGYLERARSADPEADYVQGDAADLPFEDHSFDIVLCGETLEHVPDPQKVFNELARVASQYLVVTVPGRTLPSLLLKAVGLIKEKSQEERLAKPGQGHLHDIWVSDVLTMCNAAGFSKQKVIVDCFVTVKLARFLHLSNGMMQKLNSMLEHVPLFRKHGLVQIIVASR